MPDFDRAEISTGATDLTPYTGFLRKLQVGQSVTLPLEEGESTRRVMRALNNAAAGSGMRLSRLPSESGSVRFRVLPPERRQVNISEEARRARTEKARVTRAAHQAEREQLAAMSIDPDAAGPAGPTTRPARRRRAPNSASG
jgi:hypothetical protein